MEEIALKKAQQARHSRASRIAGNIHPVRINSVMLHHLQRAQHCEPQPARNVLIVSGPLGCNVEQLSGIQDCPPSVWQPAGIRVGVDKDDQPVRCLTRVFLGNVDEKLLDVRIQHVVDVRISASRRHGRAAEDSHKIALAWIFVRLLDRYFVLCGLYLWLGLGRRGLYLWLGLGRCVLFTTSRYKTKKKDETDLDWPRP